MRIIQMRKFSPEVPDEMFLHLTHGEQAMKTKVPNFQLSFHKIPRPAKSPEFIRNLRMLGYFSGSPDLLSKSPDLYEIAKYR
jgi:hypothetical protein